MHLSSLLLVTLMGLLMTCVGMSEADLTMDRYIRAKRELLREEPEFYLQRSGKQHGQSQSESQSASFARAEAVIKHAGFTDMSAYLDVESQVALLKLYQGFLKSDTLIEGLREEVRQGMVAKLKDPGLDPAQRARLENCLKSSCQELEEGVRAFKHRAERMADTLSERAPKDPAFIRAVERRQKDLDFLDQELLRLRKAPVQSASPRR